jgi:hypothetical protein
MHQRQTDFHLTYVFRLPEAGLPDGVLAGFVIFFSPL